MHEREECIKGEEKLVEGEASEDENRLLHYILDLAKNGHFSALVQSHLTTSDNKPPLRPDKSMKELYVKVTRIPNSHLFQARGGALIGYLVQRERNFVWKCYSCPSRHRNRTSLLNHYAYHLRAFACDQCPSKFKSSVRLKYHVKVIHGNRRYRKLLLKCAYCSLEYQYRARYDAHLLSHWQEQRRRAEANKANSRAC